MTKPRTKTRSKPKSKSKSRKPSSRKPSPIIAAKVTPVVVALPRAGVVLVNLPPGEVPLMAHDPIKRQVVIAPVPRKKGFWESIFG